MKISILILIIIFSISLTSCSSTDKVDINEFIKKYNSLSETPISKESLTVTETVDRTIHNILINKSIMLTLVSDEFGEIIECSVSTSSININNRIKDVCVNALMSITGCDKTTAEKAITEASDKQQTPADYEIHVNQDNVQTTIIIRPLTENTNNNPTLKEFLK